MMEYADVKADSKPYCVVSIGDLVLDVILSVPQLPVKVAEHQILDGLQMEPGGAGNFLIAGARLGMEMTALAPVGEDMFSQALVDMLVEEGVKVDGIMRQANGSTTTVFVLEDNLHRHVFLGQYGQGSAVEFPTDWKKRIAAADILQLWGYSLHEERLVDCVLEAAAYARGQEKMVVFDPGPLLASASAEQCKKLVSCATVVLCTEEELVVLGTHCGLDPYPEAILTLGPSIVCVKLGQKGCKICTPDGVVTHAGYAVPVVDTNAAGDSFMAAFEYGLLSGWSMDAVAAFANAMGAAKVQKFGSGRQVPNLNEVRKVLREFDVDIAI